MCESRCCPGISAWTIIVYGIHINDVNYSVWNMALRLYADDTTGYNSDTRSLGVDHLIFDGGVAGFLDP